MSSLAGPSANTTRRVESIDIARALAIIGVVLGHTVEGMINAEIIAQGHRLAQVHEALYILRMPAMAFVVGLFIPGSVLKRGAPRYIADRVTLMVYLYVIWFFVQGVVEVAASRLKNEPRGAETLLQVWITYGHLWFLPFLAVGTTVVVLVRPWPARQRALVLVGLLAISVMLWGWNVQVVGLRGLSLLFFVAAGAAIGLRRMGRLLLARPLAWLGAGVVGTGLYLLLLPLGPVPGTEVRDYPDLGTRALSLAVACAGIVVLLAISVALARVPRVAGFLASIGRSTLPIYLAHLIVVAGARVVLDRLGLDVTWVYVVVAVGLGMLVPLGLHRYAGRLRLGWLFEMPPRLSEAVAARVPARPEPAPAPTTTR